MIPRFRPEIGAAELAVLLRRHDGAVQRFEEAFADAFGARSAVAFPYGRSALWAFLRSVGLEGANVAMPAYTCSVVAHAIVLSGNRPSFVDIRARDFSLDLDHLESALGAGTQAVVATHLFGYPLDLDRLEKIVAAGEARHGHKIWLIQDCAHAFGATWNGRLVGTSGDVALYAFNISKTMTAIFGGMLTFSDASLADRVRAWRDRELHRPDFLKAWRRRLYLVAARIAFMEPVYGLTRWAQEHTPLLDRLTRSYHLDDRIEFPPGHLDRMLDVEAAVGLRQLQRYPAIVAAHRENAAWYDRNLVPPTGCVLPPIVDGATYSHYVVRVANRMSCVRRMATAGVEAGELIQYSVPELDSYAAYRVECPVALEASRNTINLPMGRLDERRRMAVKRAFEAA
ncbi:MAG TPA: DegT/DnrJ/EryC1/StrS aminotransferase family protein [Caldimonas sp.]|nr:DegT/DnrJ/EryC1/StrS aminotransferase family protein [Caldimonas sp.]